MRQFRSSLIPEHWRRAARLVALAGVAVSAIGLFHQVAAALPPGSAPAGTVRMVPESGDSGTTFSLQFDAPGAPQLCPGDNTASYLWHTFITPATNDPAPMQYSPSGIPQGPAFTNNLANAIGTRTRNVLPGLGDGNIIQPTGLTFSNTDLYDGLTPGDYLVGISCTLPDNATGEVNTVKFWAAGITILAESGAGPNNFTYAPVDGGSTTTTIVDGSSTTTVAGGSSTSTTVADGSTTSTTLAGGSSTTTTTAGTTTTTTTVPCPTASTTTSTTSTTAASTSSSTSTTTSTLAGGTTTTTTVPCPTASTTTTTTIFRASGAGSGSSSQGLANTGPSQTVMVIVWAVLLLVFGRMAILLAKPIKVITDS